MGTAFQPDGIAVVIPALDEAEAVPLVLADLAAMGLLGTTVVVDNGSRDGTARIARAAGASVAVEPRRGYGAACLRGLGFVRDSWPSTRIVVFVDADRSDDPMRIPALVGPIAAGDRDLVLGCRERALAARGAVKLHQRIGNEIVCRTILAMFGHRFRDLGPFRAISVDALRRLDMGDTGYGWTVEMQVKALQQGLRVLEVPVPYRLRIGRSKISGTVMGSIGAAVKIGWTIAALRFRPVTPSRGSS
ncbi:MAG: glycosyltransferase family 2 protein [Acidobacteria bacterium]|nr:glycosyltransferase family 2 protein [Acidobacteriota bacterium]